MNPSLRNLALLLMLAAASVQSAVASPLLAGALALGFHGAHRHGHAVALLADAGHFDLVLSHAGHGAENEGAARREDGQPSSFSESDHVLHVTGDDPANASARRPGFGAAAPPAIAVAAHFAPCSAWLASAAPAPVRRSCDHLRSVVLRL